VAKYNIDDILSELGVASDKPDAAKSRRLPKGKSEDAGGEATYSPLPSMPANQRTFLKDDNDTPRAHVVRENSTVAPASSDLYKPETHASDDAIVELGQFLVAKGIITAEKLSVAQGVVRGSPGRKLEDVLVEQGTDEVALIEARAEIAGIPFERVDLDRGLEGGFDGKLLQRLTPDFCIRNLVLPLRTEGSRVVIGATQAENVFLIDEIRQRLGVPSIKLVLVPGYDIKGAMEIIGEGVTQDVDVSKILSEVDDADVTLEKKESGNEVDLEKEAGESPVIRYVNFIIQTAVKEGASDIHIEPSDKKLRVRFRIDGELFESMNPPATMGPAIISRLKIMGNLDISERRLPQDGRIRCTVQGRKLDLRMSTLPNTYGEKVVLRILDTKSINVELDNLGFDEDTLVIWKKLVNAPHGIVLVTGPTGSGKTTTLYASLRILDKNSMNISTVEDPVEYHLEGITQTQMHEKIGMTFATALRSLLRQDPDVLMLGEIRDQETAHVAVQAALTGHLVLSTLHTNDAPSSITRLINIGLEPFLVGAAVNGVLAQRLIRRLCLNCKVLETPSDEIREFLAMQSFESNEVWVAKGCDKCRQTGYAGRVGIYEMLSIDDQVRDIISRNPNVSEFRRLCIERGMVTLRQDGMRKVVSGLTTIPEVLRVTDANI
jgi:type IV pilus assembly protein PilB